MLRFARNDDGTRRRQGAWRPAINWWGVLSVVVVLAAWQGIARHFNTVLFPGPYETAIAMWDNAGAIFGEIGNTLRRAFTAFGLSLAIMVPFGIACGRIRPLGLIVDPILEFLVTIPPPAVIPIVMLFAGVGDVAKIAVITYGLVPNLLINTIETVRRAPPMMERVGRSLRFSRIEVMTLIDLPAAMPGIVTGMRLSVTTSLLVTITSEMLLSTNGIGAYVQRAQQSFQVSAGLAGIVAIAITGMLVNLGLRQIEERLLFWHYRTSAAEE
ncbi:MAG TPA: ABC transporter permease [Hyphomicrobiales bacterium]|nr:ABC transporter permease [Hyphomicrobiales bacterium]